MASNLFRQYTNDDHRDAVVIRDRHTCCDQQKRDAMNTGLLRHPVMQRFLTWQTGLPHSNQTLRPSHPMANLAKSTLALALGMLCCDQALLGPWPCWGRGLLLLPLGWGAILAAMRNFRLPNRHSAGHGHLTGQPQLDACIGQVLSAFLLTAPMSRYINSHVADASKAHHRWTILMTPGEATFEEIRALGLQPGVPNAVNWRHLKRLLLSPRFYSQQLAGGLHDAFCTGTVLERTFTATVWVMIVVVASATHHLLVVLVAYGVPRVLYEGCQVLRVLIEHTYAEPGRPRTLATYRRMTSAIILADPVPAIPSNANKQVRCLKWIVWSLHMVMHLAARLFIATGDVVNHPTHHLRPGASFINHEMERMNLIKAGHAIPSNWGLLAAIDSFFTSLSKQPRNLFTGH
jgi:hypothetical protein